MRLTGLLLGSLRGKGGVVDGEHVGGDVVGDVRHARAHHVHVCCRRRRGRCLEGVSAGDAVEREVESVGQDGGPMGGQKTGGEADAVRLSRDAWEVNDRRGHSRRRAALAGRDGGWASSALLATTGKGASSLWVVARKKDGRMGGDAGRRRLEARACAPTLSHNSFLPSSLFPLLALNDGQTAQAPRAEAPQESRFSQRMSFALSPMINV